MQEWIVVNQFGNGSGKELDLSKKSSSSHPRTVD
ncbi:Uncharacterised protein [Streptococcus suis]|nr:Uncharacterised protein [Streptococcus suis]